MRQIKKVLLIVGQVLGLLLGDNLATPVLEVTKNYPDRYPYIF